MDRNAIALLIGLLLCTALPAQQGCAHPIGGATPPPLRSIHAYLCGFHFYNGDPSRQLTAHHYCSRVSPEVMQCVLYDANRQGARLVGIEYIVSARLFGSFPEEEKRLWHSHRFEVKSGQLVAPGLTEAAEKLLMRNLVLTYGKIWQTWQVDRNDQVPMGIPQLLMGFTADGQVDPGRVAQRDREAGVSTADKKARRAEIPAGPVETGADTWQKGVVIQLEARPVK